METTLPSGQVGQSGVRDQDAYAAGMRAALRVDTMGTTEAYAAVLLLVGQALLSYVESRGLLAGENKQAQLEPIIASFCSGFFIILDHRE